MNSSDLARITVLGMALAFAGCDKSSSFTGEPGSGIGGGGISGGGGGGSGGGGSGGGGGFIEPIMQYGPAQSRGFGKIQISGDAGEIVFVDDSDPVGQNPSNEWQLFSVDIGTGNVVQITDGSATAVPAIDYFDLTDNGDFVVWRSSDDFTGDNPNNLQNVFLGSTSSGAITQVTDNTGGRIRHPQVATDLVVFLSDGDLTGDNPSLEMHVFSISTTGANLTQVTNQALDPDNLALSDDGSTVAFEGLGDPFGSNGDGTREIFVINTDGTGLTQITTTDGDSLLPELSDNGSRVVFTSQADVSGGGNADGNYELYVAQTDGSGIVRITDDDENAGTFENGTPGGFDISGNGAFVVFGARGDLVGQNPLTHTIYWATTDGATIQQILRQGTVPDDVYANQNFGADQPSILDDGAGLAFESTINFTSGTVPTYQKIYTTVRN